jgi:Na+-driven multidrug efflux pump
MQRSLLMAGGMGIFLLTITQLFARPMLAAVATNADMMQPALTYLRIRILSQPAVGHPPPTQRPSRTY